MLRNKIKLFFSKDKDSERSKRTESALELIEVRKGIKPAVIIINGFLSENEEDISDWLETVDQMYPHNELFHAKWKAGNVKEMLFDETGFASNMKIFELGRAKGKLGLAASLAAIALNKTTGYWKSAFDESKKVGVELANALANDEAFDSAILMGHSLGARVIHHALTELKSSVVSVVYLLAGAVSSDSEHWEDIFTNHPHTTFINCMSNKDLVLKGPYKIGSLFGHQPIGLAPLRKNSCSNLHNIDVTDYTTGHTDYKNQKIGHFLKEELMKLDEIKRQELIVI